MDPQLEHSPRARRPSGREAKRAARTARAAASVPYITRKIPRYEVLGSEGLELLELLLHVGREVGNLDHLVDFGVSLSEHGIREAHSSASSRDFQAILNSK